MKILACMYGGEYGYNALGIASRIAKETDSELTVMYVVERLPDRFVTMLGETAGGPGKTVADLYRGIPNLKDSIFEKVDGILKEHGVTAKKKFVTRKKVADAILEESDEKYDLVVLGSARFSGMARRLFGSVSYQVAEFANVPVLVVKRKTDEMKKILICTDGSESAKSACAMGAMLGRALGAKVTMLSVSPEFFDEDLAKECNQGAPAVVKKKVSIDIEALQRDGKQVLVYARKPLEKSIEVELICRAGEGIKSVRKEILKEAPNYDMVVCGSRGLSRMERVKMGHVSLSLNENADTNVLIVRRIRV